MEDWICERCNYCENKKQGDYSVAKCRLCHKYEGAMVKDNLHWYHIQCVNWTPEIYWEDEDKKDKIAGSLQKCELQQVEKNTCGYCGVDNCY